MALSWTEVGALLQVTTPREWPTAGPVTRLECRPEAGQSGDLFCVFPEFHTYQRWWSTDEIWREIRDLRCRVMLGLEDLADLDRPVLRCDEPAIACAHLAKAHWQRRVDPLPMVGVTGTNGKTTTVRLISHLFNQLGHLTADLGTLGTYLAGQRVFSGEYTTDLAIELHRKLGALESKGARMGVMEVSSHALALDRVAAVNFAAGVLTNVTRDHLDFHGSAEAYRAAKRKLFASLGKTSVAVLNADDNAAAEFAGATAARVVTYGAQPWADMRLLRAGYSPSGTRFSLVWEGKKLEGTTPLVGSFQLQNVLAAVATLLATGSDSAATLAAVPSFSSVPGRMERITLPNGALVIIDYAHNPDGLRRVLESCRALNPRRLWVVFGCGGDRDRGKRPLMGAVAETLCAGGWITSDNPRTEDPCQIVADIARGIGKKKRFPVIVDRTAAIRAALDESREGDVVVIAGKGHEDYQIVGTRKLPYSDHRVVEAWLGGIGGEPSS
jgi:UDP-N-acetylmuramoyl-L-alanyl-D-glutamate--2,6-diaminopimelate ligase